MWDIHNHNRGGGHKKVNITVHEHRAPTDESVRLLSQMERAAEDKLINVTRVSSNTFNAKWHVFQDNGDFEGVRVRVRYKLNELDREFEFNLCRFRFSYFNMAKPEENVMRAVYEEIVRDIAATMTFQFFKESSEVMFLRHGLDLKGSLLQ